MHRAAIIPDIKHGKGWSPLPTKSTHPGSGCRAAPPKSCCLQVIGDVLALNIIARNLHRRRFEDGALRLDKVKLGFGLDEEGNPDTYRIQGRFAAR